jgi:hypothetical protein
MEKYNPHMSGKKEIKEQFDWGNQTPSMIKRKYLSEFFKKRSIEEIRQII